MPNESPLVTFSLYLCLSHCLESFPHCLIIIYTQSTVTLPPSGCHSPGLTSSSPYNGSTNNGFQQYITDFQNLSLKARIKEEFSLINQFSFGLDQKIASMILSMATIPTTVKGWIDQAKIFHAQKMRILALQKGQIAPQAHLPSHSHYDPNAMDVHTVTLSKLTPVEQAKCMKEGQCFRCRMLRGLCNQISSSAHLSVVRRHVEFWSLGSFTSSDEKLARLKSH